MKQIFRNHKLTALILAVIMVVSIASIAYATSTSASFSLDVENKTVTFENSYIYGPPDEKPPVDPDPDDPPKPDDKDNGLLTIEKKWNPTNAYPTDWGVKVTITCNASANLPSDYGSYTVYLTAAKSKTYVYLPIKDLDNVTISWTVTEVDVYKNFNSTTKTGTSVKDVYETKTTVTP